MKTTTHTIDGARILQTHCQFCGQEVITEYHSRQVWASKSPTSAYDVLRSKLAGHIMVCKYS